MDGWMDGSLLDHGTSASGQRVGELEFVGSLCGYLIRKRYRSGGVEGWIFPLGWERWMGEDIESLLDPYMRGAYVGDVEGLSFAPLASQRVWQTLRGMMATLP